MAKVNPPKETDYKAPKNTNIGAVSKNSLLPGVTSEVNAEIAAQIAPINADVTSLTNRQERSSTDINNLFTNLQGVVEGSTGRLRTDSSQALEMERSIFQEAQNRLGSLSQQRAADAQALAQQLGIDVPLEGLFRGQADAEGSLFAGEASTRLLSAGVLRDNALSAAEAFSGRVFPLLRAEEDTRNRNYFQDEITKRKAEIKAIKGTKKGQINAKLRERLIQDRQFQLDKATANRNWWLATKGLELERDRIDTELATTQAQLDSTGEQLDVQVSESAKDRAARTASEKRAEALQRKKLGLNRNDMQIKQKENIIGITNAMISPGKDIATVTTAVPVQAGTPDAINIGTFTNPQWVKYVKETRNFAPGPENNPNRILDMIMSQTGINKKKNPVLWKHALTTIRNRYRAAGVNIDDWVPGQAPDSAQPTGPRTIPGRGD